ncbi:hypothetical protein LEP1GSC034_1286 [Leptospira interrogans str. 2003000735]|uniref:Uncharacterized protein n=2 Tax=Leptospira interrogans TaxID=173 RepID=A0A0E2DN16_LEPIR|nr:hypothetical protein LEP1GSC007_0815 [Leptospira interrogans serovar Bulgarica str. Mallika]EKN86964.1 hypothetical protein LEP1GSC027_0217 [Leptospira interrogans str. 2002000624]EKQ48503.1 hypothetical protein LEP1GSC026_2762 [Leptospira interrogans str. 2002000623]EKR46469.1 hypothetical protein LEP1GSC097_4700 [Leptospira interrogans serovar Grippotyphosa str. UI 08368]EKR57025.1 hypothetical protein LEP1GSC105_4879 [Leptospira interrogans str. UI 12758]EMJ35473.1 hypothetical protein L
MGIELELRVDFQNQNFFYKNPLSHFFGINTEIILILQLYFTFGSRIETTRIFVKY